LGAERINLLGASYGSHLALATIRRHGEHISRAVIGLVEGPDHTYKLPSTIQAFLEGLGATMRDDPGVGGMMPDLAGALAELLARLERHPQSLPVDTPSGEVRVVVGPFDLQLALSGWLGDAQFVARLPALVKTMLDGQFGWLAAEAITMRQEWFGNAMFWHMDCASGGSPERRERIAREAPTTLLGDAINLPFPDVCEAWGCPDLGPAFRAPIVSTVPTLFFSGALDVRTPIANALEVARGFAHSQHLIVEGLGHDYPTDPETTAAIVGFLRDELSAISYQPDRES
jgi:pimeloyl-ACP methyl ester carboxylesterase